ncbi:MAG: PLP-dependent aminotransferase family protein [Solirubrobacteraceae bacterium]|nr:PLP-dependent aminotransferase family protein [Solirubrobacteraceae bacterium]
MSTLAPARLASLLGDWRAQGPAYRDLADAVRVLIIDGRIPDGTRLPSERSLAEELDVSRTTTTRAYEELRERDLATAVQGSGTRVTVPFRESAASAMIAFDEPDGTISLAHAAGAAPAGLRSAFERALERMPGTFATTGYLPDGHGSLRERIAEHHSRQGLPTDPEQIIVTSGAQGALSIVAATVVRRGRPAIVEACAFPHGLEAFEAEGARPLPLPTGPTPWQVEDLRSAAASAEVALLNPDFHNPTGALMPADDREQIAAAMRREGTLMIVDETMRELNLDGIEMPPPLASFAPDAITVGSLSKVAWGGLRVGWIRAPHHLVNALVQTRVRMDLGSSAFEQLVAAEVMEGAIPAERRADLRVQRDVFVRALRRELPDFAFGVPAGGLNLWVELPGPLSSRLTTAALERRLRLLPGPRFFTGRSPAGERFIRLPFAQPVDVLERAVERLAAAWRAVDGGVATGAIAAGQPTGLDLIA